MRNEDTMYEFGLSEYIILFFVALVFAIGIYTLVKFMKSKNF